MSSRSYSALAPAKINLALHITGQRADGYHLLDSIVVFTRYGDFIEAQPASRDSFTITGTYGPALIGLDDDDNLVIRARDRLRATFGKKGLPEGPVRLHLQKNLPPASGMGGGSGDAATTLKLLQLCWKHALDADDLQLLAVSLGADVPMCLAGVPLRASGIGEQIKPLDGIPALPIVLLNPGVGVSTPMVFKQLPKKDSPRLPELSNVIAPNSFVQWLEKETRNDMQSAAISLVPEIAACLDALSETMPLLARMTGSGATCFAIYENLATAEAAAKAIALLHPNWFVQATQTYASGATEVMNANVPSR